MKKNGLFAGMIIAAATMLFGGLTAANAAEPVRVAALKGPTAMGLIQLWDEPDTYSMTLADAPDQVAPLLAKGEVDIAAVPANLAAVLYNNLEGQVEVIDLNTLGVLYIVDRGAEIGSIQDLKGKTIYASGYGATPQYCLEYLLTENGLDPEKDVTIEWKSEHAECLAALTSDENGIAMLPQPFVTTAQLKDPEIHVSLDLNAEWEDLQASKGNPAALVTGVTVVRKAFLEEHPEEVDAFLKAHEASVTFVNENPEEAGALIGVQEIMPEQVAVKAIPFCNIVCITGDEMKEMLSGYLEVLNQFDPKAVGGTLPGEDLYFTE